MPASMWIVRMRNLNGQTHVSQLGLDDIKQNSKNKQLKLLFVLLLQQNVV